ncbi:hypothetical protein ABZW03_40435 [Kitasatospora sp. NPDC004799]|uniref:hypothetical protein n=1 Tax=Kitasatospora sp. NPDC004799 TaxID=3154460 RepID=UPI0033AFF155
MTNGEVAAALVVTLSTLKTRLGDVRRELGARNGVDVAAGSWQLGLTRVSATGGSAARAALPP